MGDLYTCGTWTVVPGREDDFVAAWQDLADWTLREIPGARWAELVRSQEKPNGLVRGSPSTLDKTGYVYLRVKLPQ
jgi:hypothetical protein